MKPHRLLTVISGTVLLVLAAALIVFWMMGQVGPSFAVLALGIIAALGVVLRMWFVTREDAEYQLPPTSDEANQAPN